MDHEYEYTLFPIHNVAAIKGLKNTYRVYISVPKGGLDMIRNFGLWLSHYVCVYLLTSLVVPVFASNGGQLKMRFGVSQN